MAEERIPQSIAKLVVFRAYLTGTRTPATGKTIAITISKNGAAFGNIAAGATNATEISSGFYKFTLAAGDVDTQGPLAWRGAEGTIDEAGEVLEVTDPGDLTTAVLNKIADRIGRRTIANLEASADGDTLGEDCLYGLLRQLQASDTTTNPGFLTIFKADGTTELAQIALASDAAADPVTGVG